MTPASVLSPQPSSATTHYRDATPNPLTDLQLIKHVQAPMRPCRGGDGGHSSYWSTPSQCMHQHQGPQRCDATLQRDRIRACRFWTTQQTRETNALGSENAVHSVGSIARLTEHSMD